MCIIYDVPNTANLQFFLEYPNKIHTFLLRYSQNLFVLIKPLPLLSYFDLNREHEEEREENVYKNLYLCCRFAGGTFVSSIHQQQSIVYGYLSRNALS